MTTVSKIKKGRPSREEMEQNREAMSEVEAPSVKKLAEFYPLMNKRMLDWVNQAQKRNIRITSAMLQERAKVVADSIGWTSFRASSGWCVKFLRRNNIKLRTLKQHQAQVYLPAGYQVGRPHSQPQDWPRWSGGALGHQR